MVTQTGRVLPEAPTKLRSIQTTMQRINNSTRIITMWDIENKVITTLMQPSISTSRTCAAWLRKSWLHQLLTKPSHQWIDSTRYFKLSRSSSHREIQRLRAPRTNRSQAMSALKRMLSEVRRLPRFSWLSQHWERGTMILLTKMLLAKLQRTTSPMMVDHRTCRSRIIKRCIISGRRHLCTRKRICWKLKKANITDWLSTNKHLMSCHRCKCKTMIWPSISKGPRTFLMS